MGATVAPEKPKAKGTLTDKQEQFCLEYLIDFNATQAAIRAGYSAKTAHSQGPRLLENVEVQARLAELKKERREKPDSEAQRVIEELKRLSFANITDIVEFNESGATFLKDSREIKPEHAAAIESIGFKEDNSGVSFKLKMHSKPQALRMLGQHYDLFKEKVEISAEGGFAAILAEALNRSAQAKKGDK